MSLATAASQPLTRQACETCRRKKTKCSAERPSCSFCLRLNIPCVYMPRGSSSVNGVRKKASVDARRIPTTDRVELLERHIDHIYGLLGSSDSRHIELSPETTGSGIGLAMGSPDQPIVSSRDVADLTRSPGQYCAFNLERPQPPVEVLEHFVEIYRTKVHLQPLPLFRLDRLTDQLLSSPPFLLWSFLSLMLTISSHEFFKGQEDLAKDFYSRSGEETTTKLSMTGNSRPDVTRSLCLIALRHIKCTSRLAQAWMTIGNASRLYAVRALFRSTGPPIPEDDSEIRAYWSVFVLERLFLPGISEPSAMHVPGYPQSASLPPPVPSSTGSASSSNVTAAEITEEPPEKDIGINGYCMRIISIWGKIRLYLQRLCQGDVEKPWLADSNHTKLGIELIEFEAQHSRHHLLLNVGFPRRSAAEISQQNEYWNPWMTTEILWHASHAILNHPFLHLFVLRSQKDIPQSCVFLQQKVDMALYHASWLCRILQLSENLMVISNPLIGDAIAASATVLWLFQFTRDGKVAQRTRANLDTCETFMSTIARMWPHVVQKLTTLKRLRILADRNRSETTYQDTTISFKPEWFWDLLVPSIQETDGTSGLGPMADSGNGTTSKMRLRSHFIDRLPEESDIDRGEDHLGSDPFSLGSFPTNLDNLELFHVDELSRDFFGNDFWNMGD